MIGEYQVYLGISIECYPVSYDWQLGECDCLPFVRRKMKTISFGCLRAEKIFEDVLGRMWTEKDCTHEWFILWIQLYSEIMEKLPR